MEIRDATPDDVEALQRVARASMRASYGHAIDEAVLDDAVGRWYDAETLHEDLAGDAAVIVVAVDDGEVVGFGQSYVLDRRERVGEIDWVHVHPDHRGRGVGTRLLGRVEAALRDHDVARIEGRVLAENAPGGTFYADHGYDPVGERTVRVGDGEFVERTFSKVPEGEAPGGEVVLERRTGPAGQTLYVAVGEAVRGSRGPFFAVYADGDAEERYGWVCGEDDSLNVAMDPMERLECNDCGNRSKPARWDAAYL
jgi:ribosomal protein S18 acetylase RimI-like enzyme